MDPSDHESTRVTVKREDGTLVVVITPPPGHGLVWSGSSRLDGAGGRRKK